MSWCVKLLENGDYRFEKGVEQRAVQVTEKDKETMTNLEIPFFLDWSAADEAVTSHCYPKDYRGMNPIANGKFLRCKSICNEEIFIPSGAAIFS